MFSFAPPPEKSALLLTFNFDEGTEIGWFDSVLSEEEYREVLESYRRSDYAQIPDTNDFMLPETSTVDIGERAPGQKRPKMRGFALPNVPASIAVLQEYVEKTVLPKIRRHKARVLSGQACWTTQTFRPDELITVNVELASVGSSSIRIANPLELDGKAGLRLSLRRENGSGGVQSIQIEAVHLRPPRPAPPGDEVWLSPQATLSFSIAKQVYLAPGRYEGHVLYNSPRKASNEADYLYGELSMPLGIMTITP
jgi:hypothetical protein